MAYNFKTDTKAQQFIAKYTDPETNVTGTVYILMTDNEEAADIDNGIALGDLYLVVSAEPFLIGDDPEPDGDGE